MQNIDQLLDNNNNNRPIHFRRIWVDLHPLNDPQNPNLTDDESDSEENIAFWQRVNQNNHNPGFLHNLGRYYPDFLWPTKYLKLAAFVFTLTLFEIFVKGYFNLDTKKNKRWKEQFVGILIYFVTFTFISNLLHKFCQLLYRIVRNLAF